MHPIDNIDNFYKKVVGNLSYSLTEAVAQRCKKVALENFANSTWKQLSWSLFLIKLQDLFKINSE